MIKSAKRSRQSGVALIFALVIVALVAGLSVKLAANHDRTIWRTEARWHGLQAQQYLYGAEQLGILALNLDYESDESSQLFTDHELEEWAFPVEFPLDEGGIRGQLMDAQSRFDLNRLEAKATNHTQYGALDPQRFTEDQKRFIRLLQTFEDLSIGVNEAVQITEAIVDWIDSDSTSFGFGGAESLFYTAEDPVIEPPNHPMDSVSELRLIRHMTAELYQQLAPLVTVLREGQGVNVNTASLPLFRSLNIGSSLQPLSENEAQLMIDGRGAEGFPDLNDFVGLSVIQSLTGTQGAAFVQDGLTVDSQFYQLSSEVQVGEQRRQMTTLFKRDGQNTIVIKRSRRDF